MLSILISEMNDGKVTCTFEVFETFAVQCFIKVMRYIIEPRHDKTNKMSEHPPSLIRVFAVRSMGS